MAELCVVLDIGDVLVSTSPMRPYQTLERLTGVPASWARHRLDGSSLVAAYEIGGLNTRDFVVAASRVMGFRYLPVDVFAHAWNSAIRGIDVAIAQAAVPIAAAGKLALASNINPLHWSLVFSQLALLGLRAPSYLSFRLGHAKPERQFFESIHFASAQVIYVDDQVDNVRAAVRHGMVGHLHRESRITAALLTGVLAD